MSGGYAWRCGIEETPWKPPEPIVQQTIVDRWLAILRAIALHTSLKPEELKRSLGASPGRRSGMSTIYKDLGYLKDMSLREPSRHRQGYCFVGANQSHEETQVLLNGLRIQAEDLGNPVERTLYERLMRRTATTQMEKAFMLLHVEAVAYRPVVRTNQEDFADVMGHLGELILKGRRVRLRLVRNAWQPRRGNQ